MIITFTPKTRNLSHVCVYVCIYMYIYVCMHVCMYVCMYVAIANEVDEYYYTFDVGQASFFMLDTVQFSI